MVALQEIINCPLSIVYRPLAQRMEAVSMDNRRWTVEPAHFFVNTSSVEYTGRCTLRSEGKLVLYEPSNGEERSLSWEKTGDAAKRISLKLRPFEALFVLVR